MVRFKTSFLVLILFFAISCQAEQENEVTVEYGEFPEINGKDLFDTPPCRGYQYVWMPPRYEMVIHKDLSAIKSRIGSLLEGSGDIIFYDEEDNIIDKYNYEEDILTDVQVRHNVINSDEWRLTFFANFEEPVDVIKVQL